MENSTSLFLFMAGFPNPFFFFSSPCGKEHIQKGHKLRKILSGINSAEDTGVQHGAGRSTGLWVLMVLHEHLWRAEKGQSKKLLLSFQMVLPRGELLQKELLTGIGSLVSLDKPLH